jgi:hypothetical protein
MQQFTGKAVHARPLRHMRRVVVSGCDDHLAGVDVAGRRAQPPATGPAVDPFDGDRESDV